MTSHQDELRAKHKKALSAIEQMSGRLEKKVCFHCRGCDLLLTQSWQSLETEDTSEKLGNLRQAEAERKQQIAGYRANIEKLKGAIENRPADVDTTQLDKEIVGVSAHRSSL